MVLNEYVCIPILRLLESLLFVHPKIKDVKSVKRIILFFIIVFFKASNLLCNYNERIDWPHQGLLFSCF